MARPGAVMLFVLLHVAVWTLLPTLVFPTPPLDVIENLAWGREWQLGYSKHPPLQAWTCELASTLAGGRAWGVYLGGQLLMAVAFLAAWRLGRAIADPLRAGLAVVGLEATFFYSYATTQLNANLMLIPFWSLGGWLFWRAYRSERVAPWLTLGLVAGLGFLAKYFFAMLALTLAVFLVSTRRGRGHLASVGPWAAAAVCILVITPHLYWLVDHEFMPFQHALTSAGGGTTPFDHLVEPARFMAAQATATGLLLVAMAYAFGVRGWAGTGGEGIDLETQRYLLTICFVPFLLSLGFSAVTGARLQTMWGTPLWCFLPLVLLVRRPTVTPRQAGRLIGAVSVVAGVWVMAFLGQYLAVPLTAGRPKRVHLPGRELAAVVTDRWRAATGKPLRIVAGEPWHVGVVGFYSTDRPSAFLRASRRLSPWIDPEVLRRDGAAIVYPLAGDVETPPGAYRIALPGWIRQEPIMLDWQRVSGGPPLRVGLAIYDPDLADRMAREKEAAQWARRRAADAERDRRYREHLEEMLAYPKSAGWGVTD